MHKKKLLLIIASLSIVAMILHSSIGLQFSLQIARPVRASPTTINVPMDYATIQEAINAANSGDVILVGAETYYEHIVVNKTVSLVGENPATTVIDGSGIGIVVRIRSSNVTIRGFTIQNGGATLNGCGIYATNHTEKINNNTIRNNHNGVRLLQSNGSNIIGNTLRNNTWALHISESNENIIHGNTVVNNSIGAWIPSSSTPNTFYHNTFVDNAIQASDFGPSKWDNGTEGNFWSDYTGIDGNGNGIGDTPHEMDPGMDYYPLMRPRGDKEFPVAEAGPGQIIFQGMTIAFDGSGSHDNVGIKDYVWTFVDVTPKILTEVRPTYRFKNVGNFSVTLNVTDYVDNWDTDTTWINVSRDNTEPAISNLSQEPTVPNAGENVAVSIDVTDEQSGVCNVTISYRTNNGPWNNVSMSKHAENNTWKGQILGQPAGTNVTYWILAYDNAENPTIDDNGTQYYVYTVVPEFPVAILLPLFIITTLVAAVLRKNQKGISKL